MRLEHLPILLGAVVALLGLGLLVDAWSAEGVRWSSPERRRRPRADRNRGGEALVGLGTLCLAGALIGRDIWRWGNIAVIAGTVLIVVGAAMNLGFLREILLFRGPSRRQEERVPREPGAGARHAGATEKERIPPPSGAP